MLLNLPQVTHVVSPKSGHMIPSPLLESPLSDLPMEKILPLLTLYTSYLEVFNGISHPWYHRKSHIHIRVFPDQMRARQGCYDACDLCLVGDPLLEESTRHL